MNLTTGLAIFYSREIRYVFWVKLNLTLSILIYHYSVPIVMQDK
jgi:hypothetical protein